MTTGFIYLLRTRECIKTGENVYKIGKSKKEFGERFSQYPKQSQMHLHLWVEDIDLFEMQMIDIYNKVFKKRGEFGNEYFEGSQKEMINLIFCYFNSNNNNTKTDEQKIKNI